MEKDYRGPLTFLPWRIFFLIFIFSFASAFPSPSLYKSFSDCFARKKIPPAEISGILYGINETADSFSKILQSNIRNLRFNLSTTKKPAAIIVPTAESHVSAAVLCAKEHGNVQLKIRSGGHDYEGVSYVSDQPNFVVLDMANFRSINISLQDRTAWVGAGAFLGELYYRIWEKSNELAFPAGVCPTLGIGGHISGAGYGNLMRKYGVSVDHVIDARIVDAGGRILDRKTMGEDLFWAIRGGGAASFAVVLAFRINLVLVPPSVTVFQVQKGSENNAAIDTFLKYQELNNKIDDDLYIRVYVQPIKTNNTKPSAVAKFTGMFLGNATRLLSVAGSQFPELGLKKSDCLEMRWIDSILNWAGFDNKTSPRVLLNRIPKSVDYLKRKSDYVKTPIPKSAMEKLFAKVAELGKVGLAFNSYGGAMNRIPENATAFPHRAGNIFKIQYASNWGEDQAKDTEKNIELVREVYDLMEPFVAKNPREAYLNYRDLDIGVNDGGYSYEKGKVFGLKYFRGNFERLVRIKAKVDPENVFRYEQSIPLLRPSDL
ncbi:berberine bridge enzyme-like 21 [Andrographis paniculata]|uniref:berberine bridge enzyme-like 21 n=1 Tax=Andrographis paniculata TaxID=175694 RepID=UPI0021E7E6B4|nr:berberine bridge enzyme-like 21 [Andrographis paniculata]